MDIGTRRKKQRALMTELLERKIRLHAQNLYDQRGQSEGSELEDWVQAESQVLEKSTLAPLYRKTKAVSQGSEVGEQSSNPQISSTNSCACEACS